MYPWLLRLEHPGAVVILGDTCPRDTQNTASGRGAAIDIFVGVSELKGEVVAVYSPISGVQDVLFGPVVKPTPSIADRRLYFLKGWRP